MATKVIMPKQGLQMTEGNIIQWFAAEGDTVEEGKPLFEMETDKLTIEIDAPASGTLLKIIHDAGAMVPITHIIGVIGEDGEDVSEIVLEAESQSGGDGTGGAEAAGTETQGEVSETAGASGSPAAGPAPAASSPPAAAAPGAAAAAATHAGRDAAAPAGVDPAGVGRERAAGPTERRPDGQVFSSPRARWRAEQKGVDLESVRPTGPDGMVIERDVLAAAETEPAASPLARKAAAEQGVPLSSVQGSGPRGKVYAGDVAQAGAAGVGAGAAEAPAAAASREDRLVKLGGMRRTIAERMRTSLDTAAQAVHRMTVDMSEAVRMRTKLKDAEVRVSYNDIILKATAKALRENPRMNSALTDEGILEFGHVNIGVAVALDDGLIVPVIRDVDLLELQAVHAESRRLAEAAKTGALTGDDLQGGTFSVSNLGMYGLDSFTAIIDTPESGILAVGAIKEQAVPVDGEVVIRPMCELSLTYDHRVVDGAPAADFLRSVAGTLENPYMLI